MKKIIISSLTALALITTVSGSLLQPMTAAAAFQEYDQAAYDAVIEFGLYISELDPAVAEDVLTIVDQTRAAIEAQGSSITAEQTRSILRTGGFALRNQIGLADTAELMSHDVMKPWRLALSSDSTAQWVAEVQINPLDLASLNQAGIFSGEPNLPDADAMSGTEGAIIVAIFATIGAVLGNGGGAVIGAALGVAYVAESEADENGAEGEGGGEEGSGESSGEGGGEEGGEGG
jgi:hypothetical protein